MAMKSGYLLRTKNGFTQEYALETATEKRKYQTKVCSRYDLTIQPKIISRPAASWKSVVRQACGFDDEFGPESFRSTKSHSQKC